MRPTIFFSLLLAVSEALAQGDWRVTTEIDSMSDRVKRSATIVNGDGHSLSVYRGPGEAAWVLLSLGKSSFDTLAPRRAPIYRVDKNEPNDLESDRQLTESGLGLTLYAWEPRWVNFSIWHGKEAEGRSVKLRELMSGKRVVFRYTLSTGGYKETTFSLAGAGPAIAEALGIAATEDPEVAAAASAYRTEYVSASKRCQQDMPRIRACFERVRACNKQAQGDLKTLQKCLQ